MSFEMIIAAIGSLGFPIVACCAMAYFFAKTNENYRQDLKEANSKHKEEIDKITEAINNNTMVIQRLVDRMEVKDDRND